MNTRFSLMQVQETAETDTSVSPLRHLSDLLQADMKDVNRIILSEMHSDVALIPQLASHLIAAGGKRLRPLLTIASARMFDINVQTVDNTHKIAACVEFIHTATLLHDDVVDDSNMRRGNQSANSIFGNEAAVLVGDFLFSRSFQLMVQTGSMDVLRVLSTASAIIAEGEVMQLAAQHNLETTLNTYLKVIQSKTAALFAAACQVGGILADQDDQICECLHDYGLNMGIAFQIADDVLDYQADENTLGKDLGDDLREGKVTLPIIYALQCATDEDRAFWYDLFINKNFTDESFDKAREICKRHNAFEKSLATAYDYRDRALDNLKMLPDGQFKDIFADIADYVVERST